MLAVFIVCAWVVSLFCAVQYQSGLHLVGLARGAVDIVWQSNVGVPDLREGEWRIRSASRWPMRWGASSLVTPRSPDAGMAREWTIPLWPFAMLCAVLFVALSRLGSLTGRARFAAPGTRGNRFVGLAATAIACVVAAATVYLAAPALLVAYSAQRASDAPPLLSLPDATPRVCVDGVLPFHDYGVHWAGRAWHQGVFGAAPGEYSLWRPLLGHILVLSVPPLLGVALMPLVAVGLRAYLARFQPADAPSSWSQEADTAGGPFAGDVVRTAARLTVAASAGIMAYRITMTMCSHWSIPTTTWDMLKDMSIVAITAACGAVLLVVRSRWSRLQRHFTGDRAVCACGYLSGSLTACPECGRAGSHSRDYFMRVRRRHTLAMAVVMFAGIVLYVTNDLSDSRRMHRAAAGLGYTVMQRLNPADGTVYLRTPAMSRVEVRVGDQLYQINVQNRIDSTGPVVWLGADRWLPANARGTLRVEIAQRLMTDEPATDAITARSITYILDRYGPANALLVTASGPLRVTAGVHVEYHGCVELLVAGNDERPVTALRVGPGPLRSAQ